MSTRDRKEEDRSDLKLLAIILVAVVAVLLVVGSLFLPMGQEVVTALNDGLSLKDATLWGFGVTVALFVLFAVVAGDGLIGEIQFMLTSFFVFFAVISLLIAWIF